MKFMGSKNTLLASGLGELILKESQNSLRIVDLFCGGSLIHSNPLERKTDGVRKQHVPTHNLNHRP